MPLVSAIVAPPARPGGRAGGRQSLVPDSVPAHRSRPQQSGARPGCVGPTCGSAENLGKTFTQRLDWTNYIAAVTFVTCIQLPTLGRAGLTFPCAGAMLRCNVNLIVAYT